MNFRFVATVLILSVLLAGCETQAARDACLPPGVAPFAVPNEYTAPLFFYMVGCKTAQAINSTLDEKGWNTTTLSGQVVGSQYQSADGIFSVTLPGPLAGIGHAGYRINEQYLPHDDYVFFASNQSETPVYGIKVTPVLDREYAALGSAEYADLSMQDARLQAEHRTGASLDLVSEKNLVLDNKTTLFRVYRQSAVADSAHGGKSTIYYLVYFIKQDDRAAILSVLWPKPCPQCETGDEQSIRHMDPGLERFIRSFEMGTN
ncbi:MAG: hypothetical protein ACRETO_00050 [Gammaproteobacteria bacterium]